MRNIFILSLFVLLGCRESESLDIEFEANESVSDIDETIRSITDDKDYAFFTTDILAGNFVQKVTFPFMKKHG